jgi:uncharacterized protein YndB with AHSA1/START domain
MTSETKSIPEDAELEGSPAGVHSSTTVAAPLGRVWEHLISPRGTEALLGTGARLATKGEPWHSTDGTHGVLRSYHPLEQIRVSWHPHEDGPLSIVDLQLRPEGDGTRLDIFHEGRGIAEDGAGDKARWDQALERLTTSLNA